MKVLERVKNNSENLRLGMIIAIIALCLIAMFMAPSMTTQGPSRIAADGPSALIVILIGLAIGCYGTIVGIGGGPLIVPVLVLFYGWDSELLVATSLFIVFLNALSGSVGYARQKRIEYRAGIKFALAAFPGAVLSGFVHHFLDIKKFDLLFGIFLLCLAAYSYFGSKNINTMTKKLKAKAAKKYRPVNMTDRFGQSFSFHSNDKLGISMNMLLGFFVGFLGIGGGVFQIPILVFLLYYPTHIATATSHFITMLTCAMALIPHILLGNVCFSEALTMGIGIVVGAQVGAWISPKLKANIVMNLFTLVLIVFAIKLFV